MNKQEIVTQSQQTGKPVIVEFWAPWCAPCKMMTPALEKTAKEYSDSVKLLRINADDHPSMVKEFGVMGIPSIIVISEGREVSRHTGLLNTDQLEILFKSAAAHQDILIPPTIIQRVLRIGSGLILVLMGFFWGPPVILYPLGAVLIFSAIYDRCPIFRMVFPKIKSRFRVNSEKIV